MSTLPILALALLLAPQDAALLGSLSQSLPRLDGEVRVQSLAAPVTVRRDERGVPSIEGASFEDVVRGTGFVHGQDRFVQMDLMRRRAAGELAELVGPAGIGSDRAMRRHRFRAVAAALWPRLDPRERGLLEAYGEGVNAALAEFGTPPPEYVVLGAAPEPWRAEDTLLVMFAMYETLNMNASIERNLGVMERTLPRELHDFLTPVLTRFDAPLILEANGSTGYAPRAVPGPAVIDLRAAGAARVRPLPYDEPPALGSNNWAVSAERSVHGGAMVANDPHLTLSVPNIWHHLELRWPGGMLTGASLPGVPSVLIGSNGHVAWGFTNAMGDFQDLVVVEVDPDDPGRYAAPGGPRAFDEIVETIEVRGGAPVELRLRATVWGTVVDEDPEGRPLALRWTALDPERVNMRVFDLAACRSIDEALDVAAAWSGPSQNVVVADEAGRIGWTISGSLPRRIGFTGRTPRSWARGDVGWDGSLEGPERPRVVDPPSGILFTANNRTMSLATSERLGGAFAASRRAARIRERLAERDRFDEAGLLDIQLDTRCALYDFYRDLALAMVDPDDPDLDLRRAREAAAAWDGRAETTSVGLPLLLAFRRALHGPLVSALLAPCAAVDDRFRYNWMLREEPLRRVLETRPSHLLPPGAASWSVYVRDALRDAARATAERTPDGGAGAAWGAVNRPLITHPLASAAPMFEGMLNMPQQPLAGHWESVRVVTSSYGASLRMVASPGREDRAIFHMPAGQSGHPLSPHYRDGHQAWVEGRPEPLLAGEAVHVLRLVP